MFLRLFLLSVVFGFGLSSQANQCRKLFSNGGHLKLVVDNKERVWEDEVREEDPSEHQWRLEQIEPVIWALQKRPDLIVKFDQWIRLDEVFDFLVELSETLVHVNTALEAGMYNSTSPLYEAHNAKYRDQLRKMQLDEENVRNAKLEDGVFESFQVIRLNQTMMLKALEDLAGRISRIDEELILYPELSRKDFEFVDENMLSMWVVTGTIFTYQPFVRNLREMHNLSRQVPSLGEFREQRESWGLNVLEQKLKSEELEFYIFLHNHRNDPELREFFELFNQYLEGGYPSLAESRRILRETDELFGKKRMESTEDFVDFFRALAEVDFAL